MSDLDYIQKSSSLRNLDNFVFIKSNDAKERVITEALSIVLQSQKDYVLIVQYGDAKNVAHYASTLSPDKLAKMDFREYLDAGPSGLSGKVIDGIIGKEDICAVDLIECDRDLSVNQYYKAFNKASVDLYAGVDSLMINREFVLYSSDGSPLSYPIATFPSSAESDPADIFITGSDFYNSSRYDNSKDPIFKENYKRSKDKLYKALKDCAVEHTKLQSDVAYEGFSLKKMRRNFFEKTAGKYSVSEDFVSMKALINCFTAYAAIGNNVAKLKHKRTDTTASQALMTTVSSYKVESKASSKDSLTLPRIAIAFMPQYYLYRKFILKEAQNQTSSVIEVVFKDQAFAGCQKISSLGGYQEYYEEFSQMISKENVGKPDAKKQKLDTDAIKERNNKWMAISKAGFDSDREIHDLMNTALNSVNTREDAYNHILIGLNELRTKAGAAFEA